MKQFPVVKVQGSHHEVGVAIGRQMKSVIRKRLENNKIIFAKNFATRLEKSKLFLAQAIKYFPQYIAELQGIADGAGVAFAELFLLNNREVAHVDPTVLDPGHCTIIAVPTEAGYIVGHNEDWSADALELLYILDATIVGTKIFGLNYAPTLVGNSVAVNGYGLLQAVNELAHQDSQIGVPKDFIARAILDCKTLEQAEQVIKTHTRAAGFNHVLVQGRRLWNVESSAREYALEKIEEKKYLHTNHYLTNLAYLDKGNKESEARYKKVHGQLGTISTIGDIQSVLSDRTLPPVCREGTIGSVLFDLPQTTAYIAYGQPSPDSYIQMQY